MTPQQMRELADEANDYADWALLNASPEHWADMLQFRDALSTAADQLAAVQELHRWLRKNIGSPALHARLDQFAAATPLQED